MKKVSFTGKRDHAHPSTTVDNWVDNKLPSESEPMKRLTIDVSVSLHKRIKSQCALDDLVMADVIRDMLEKRFPPPQDSERGAAS